MSLYLDTSVLVSCYIPEPQSQGILELLQETQQQTCISRLAETEFYAALAIKRRTKELTQADNHAALKLFNHHLEQSVYERVYIVDTVFTMAIKFLSGHNIQLRTLDALHLACSTSIGATLVTADKILAKNAEQFNIPFKLL